jgi:excisionase family DNA binding protein
MDETALADCLSVAELPQSGSELAESWTNQDSVEFFVPRLLCNSMGTSSEMVSISEASKLLGVSPDTLRQWDIDGKLPSTKTVGGHRRYNKEAIMAFKQNPSEVIEQSYIDHIFKMDYGEYGMFGLIHTDNEQRFFSHAAKYANNAIPYVEKDVKIEKLENGKRQLSLNFQNAFFFATNHFLMTKFPPRDSDRSLYEEIDVRAVPYKHIDCIEFKSGPLATNPASMTLHAKNDSIILQSTGAVNQAQLTKIYLLILSKL